MEEQELVAEMVFMSLEEATEMMKAFTEVYKRLKVVIDSQTEIIRIIKDISSAEGDQLLTINHLTDIVNQTRQASSACSGISDQLDKARLLMSVDKEEETTNG